MPSRNLIPSLCKNSAVTIYIVIVHAAAICRHKCDAMHSSDLLIWQKWEFLYCHKNLGLNDQDRKIYGIIFICCHIGNYPPWILLRVKIGIIYKGFCKKWFFKVSKLVFFSSHYRAFGSTIPKKIFFPKIFCFKNILPKKKYFFKKYFWQKIFSEKIFFLESLDQMLWYGFKK